MSAIAPARHARHVGTDDGEAIWFIQNLAVVRVSGDDTENRLAVVELVSPPGDMPPLHVHHDEEEVFHLLAGEATFWVGAQTLQAGPGSTVVAPRGVPHTYRVDSADGATWLVITRSGNFARFVAAVGEPAAERTLPPAPVVPAPERMAEACQALGYRLEILGPPGALPE